MRQRRRCSRFDFFDVIASGEHDKEESGDRKSHIGETPHRRALQDGHERVNRE